MGRTQAQAAIGMGGEAIDQSVDSAKHARRLATLAWSRKSYRWNSRVRRAVPAGILSIDGIDYPFLALYRLRRLRISLWLKSPAEKAQFSHQPIEKAHFFCDV
jgi:hypothetical protein